MFADIEECFMHVNQRINNDIFHKNDNVIVKQDKELHSTETNTEEYSIEFKRVPKR